MGVGNEKGFFFNHNWWVYNFEIEVIEKNEKIEGGEHGEQTRIFAISETIADWWYTVHTMGPMSFLQSHYNFHAIYVLQYYVAKV